jgi:hydroxypyruvate isomerase
MNRRNFTQLALISGLGLFSASSLFSMLTNTNKHSFNLAYAPHLGMFSHHAGR